MKRSQKWLAFVVVIVIFGVVTLYRKSSDSTFSASPVPPEHRAVIASATLLPAAVVVPAAVAAEINPGDKAARLVATGTPQDAFAAAKIIVECLQARNSAVDVAQAATNPDINPTARADYANSPKAEIVCAGLSPGQLTQVNHLFAMSMKLANVPGMFSAVMSAAMFSPTDTAHDPEFNAAATAAMEVALRAGDSLALSYKAEDLASTDPELALTYHTAHNIIYASERVGKPIAHLEGYTGPADPITDRLTQQLGQAKAAAAIEAGKLIAYQTRGIK